jgi:hypothetical protein
MSQRSTAQARPSSPASDARLVVALQVFLGLMVAFQVVIFCWHAWQMVLFPYQLDYGEGPILQLALRVTRGQPLYPPLNAGYPYAIASYLPFYYLLVALAAWITGPSFLGGRLISCLAALVVAAVSGRMVWEKTRNRFAACATAGIVLAIPVFLVWSVLMRIDMVALACSIAGFHLFTRGRRLPGIILFALAVFTRWTNIAGIFAAFVGLLRERRWKTAIGWAAAQAGLILALVFGALLITKGGMYEQLRWHTSTSLGKQWSWAQVLLLLSIAGRNWPVYYAASLLGAAWCAARAPHRVLVIYLLGACAIYLTSGRVGSTFNYFLEPLALGTVAVGVFMGEVMGGREAPGAGLAAARYARWRPLMLGIAGALALQMVWTDRHLPYTISLLRPEASGSAGRRVVELIRDAPGMVICEDVGLNELAGKEPPIDPFEFTMLSRAGAIDPSRVYRDVRAGRFPLIIFRFDARQVAGNQVNYAYLFDRFPMQIIAGVLDRYELQEKTGPYHVYAPKRAGRSGAGDELLPYGSFSLAPRARSRSTRLSR